MTVFVSSVFNGHFPNFFLLIKIKEMTMVFIHEFPLILKANEDKKEQQQKGMI